MYLRHTTIRKDGKVHRYWRLVRSVRVGRRVIQQTGAQLGELDEQGCVQARALAANEIVHWTDLKGEALLLSRRDPGHEIHDLVVAKLASPADRPKMVRHDISRESIKSLVGAGFGYRLDD